MKVKISLGQKAILWKSNNITGDIYACNDLEIEFYRDELFCSYRTQLKLDGNFFELLFDKLVIQNSKHETIEEVIFERRKYE